LETPGEVSLKPITMITDKQNLLTWEEHKKAILETTLIDEKETDDQKRKRVAQLEADPEEWFKYYFPRYAFAEPADFHKRATQRVLNNPEHYEVRMWSRELAKSTRTMMEVLYITLAGHKLDGEQARIKKRYVLMVSNSQDNAIRLLMPYKANLEYNKRIIQDYGAQEQSGQWQAAEFTTLNGVAFRALGAGQSPRGTRNEEARPDIILFDDVDTDADCLNPDMVAKKWRWIEEAAIGTRSISQHTMIMFCGNRIAADSCIARAVKHADYADEVNIRDEQGVSSWPQKNTEADIERVLAQKSYAAAQKEYFNNPITEGAVFRTMAYKQALYNRSYSHLVCYTDPSYKDGKSNDYKATVLVGRILDEFHVIKAYIEQTTTAQMTEWLYDVMTFVGNSTCYYYMEELFMQDSILQAVRDAGRDGRPVIPIIGDRRQKQDKFTRIECLLEPLNRNGKLYLNEAEQNNPHMLRLEEQFLALSPNSNAHDDGPDAVEGAIWILNNRCSLKKHEYHFAKQQKNEQYHG